MPDMLLRSSRVSGKYRSELENALGKPANVNFQTHEVAAGPAVSESQVSFSQGSHVQRPSLGPVYHVDSTNAARYASYSSTALALPSSMYPVENTQCFHVHDHLEDMRLEEGMQDMGSWIEEKRALVFNSHSQVLIHDQPAHDAPYEPISQNAYIPQSDFDAYPLVDFSVDDQRGIMLADALNGCKRLSRRDVRVFTENTAQKMSLRILLLGYPKYDRQVIVRNSRTPPGSITVGKLAEISAKEFLLMLKGLAEKNYHVPFSPNDVVLLGVDRVARGSIQPRFGIIRRRLATN